MSVNPLSPATNTAAGLGSTSAAGTNSTGSTNSVGVNATSQLNEQSFLTLLSAQLKYQNPLQPMNNTQFVAELAQFSQLSAVTSQTTTLQQILQAVQGNSTNIVGASQLIGKNVTTASGQSGQVTAVSSTSSGIHFDVSGVGTIQASDIQQVR